MKLVIVFKDGNKFIMERNLKAEIEKKQKEKEKNNKPDMMQIPAEDFE